MYNEEIAKTDRTRKNIRNTLKQQLINKYDDDKYKLTNEILKIHGIDTSRMDFVTTCEQVISNAMQGGTINDISIDDNSNKMATTTEAVIQEAITPFRKLLGFDLLYREIKELYGKHKAKELTGLLYDMSLYLHDPSKIDKVYCYGMNSTSLVLNGRDYTKLKSKPPKRLQSFIATLCGTMHTISGSALAGALAAGDFFISCSRVAMNEYTIEQIKSDKKVRGVIENAYQQFVHDVNDITRSSFESPFINVSVFDRVKNKGLLNDMKWFFPEEFTENYIIDYIMEMQKIFIEFFDKGDPSSNGLPFTFPIVSINFSKDENNNIMDKAFLNYICQKDIYRYNLFISSGLKVCSCCRLLSDSEMLDVANQTNSFGGTAVNLGSHRVITINIPRLAIEAKSVKNFYKNLDYLLESTSFILKAHKQFLEKSTKAGIQPFITNGTITLNRLFSTYGIIGVYEATEILKEKFSIDYDITKEYLEFINKKAIDYGKQQGLNVNIEQVPGESLAPKLAKIDKILHKENQPYKMYSNQFIPLWVDKNALERMDEDGKYNQLLTGGGIVHIQIGEKITPKQAQHLIEYASKSGCEHFALNGVFSKCENDHTLFGNYEKCPQCDGKIVKHLTRVVGFLTEVENWNKERREWEFPKRKYNGIE